MCPDVLRLLTRPIQCFCEPGIVTRELRQPSAAPEINATVADAGVERVIVDNRDGDDCRPHPGMRRLFCCCGEDAVVGALDCVCQQRLPGNVAATLEHLAYHLDGKR